MFRIIRETFQTIRALCAMIREFFVRWFLPLHSDDEPDDEPSSNGGYLGWNWENDEDAEGEARPMIGLLEDAPDRPEDDAADITASDEGGEVPGVDGESRSLEDRP